MVKDLSDILETPHYSWSADPAQRTKQEINLLSLVQQCEPVYKELQRILGSLQLQGEHRQWKLFCKAVKSVWKEDQINDLETRLQALQRQIDSHFIADISRTEQTTAITQLQHLARMSRQLEINRTDDLRAVTTAMGEGFEALQISQTKTNTILRRAKASRSAGRSTNKKLTDLSKQAFKARTYSAEDDIIQVLHFNGLRQRQFDVKEAHKNTFEWILSPLHDQPSPAHFFEWRHVLDIGKAWVWKVYTHEIHCEKSADS